MFDLLELFLPMVLSQTRNLFYFCYDIFSASSYIQKMIKITIKLIKVLSTTTVLFCLVPALNAQSQRVLTQEDFDHVPQGLVTGRETTRNSIRNTRSYNNYNNDYRNDYEPSYGRRKFEHSSSTSNTYNPFRESYRYNGMRYNSQGNRIIRVYE